MMRKKGVMNNNCELQLLDMQSEVRKQTERARRRDRESWWRSIEEENLKKREGDRREKGER
jgi:hypothetical protein